jgi:OPT family small oligopeptide transporter
VSILLLRHVTLPDFILPVTNTFNTAYFPISSPRSWDNTGAPYNFSGVVDQDGLFSSAKYEEYSPLFLSTTLILAYCTAFASLPSVVVHTFLWFRKDIVKRFRNTLKDERDIHSRLMLAYPEVSMWWYGILGVTCFVLMCVGVEVYPTGLPAWAAFVAFLLSAVFAVPLAMLMAITNQQAPTQVLHELIAGFMLPERPVANVLFKTFAFIGTHQAVSFAGDLKLGHYMKIPPRIMFSIQVVATVVSCFVVTSVQDYMIDNVEDICTPLQKNGYSCPGTSVFATASLVWGGIGPRKMFGPGAPYNATLWFFLVGALLPIPFYLLARRFPLSFYRYVNIPIFFAGLGAIPPATGMNYISWASAGFLFNYVIRKYRFRWWMRYNYIFSAALDAGVAIAGIVIFLVLALPKGGIQLNWWGNT